MQFFVPNEAVMWNDSSVFPGGSAPATNNWPGELAERKRHQECQEDQEKQQQPPQRKKKRNPRGHADPDAEVVALSPRSLMTSNRFVCEVCSKGFQRDQNLQLHRRGHNLPWKLRQHNDLQENTVKKRVFVCPEPTCVHHNPSRALGDLTGIKKHYSRKHGEKKWKCDRCPKRYAVQSDLKAHQKTCGTREYRCDCGILFTRKDSFISHRVYCDVLAGGNVQSEGPTASVDELGDPDCSARNLAPRDVVSASDEEPSSPASELTGGPMQSRPFLDIPHTFGAVEGAVTATSSNLMDTGIGIAPSLGLSLCLGVDPSPGPLGVVQATGNQALLVPRQHSVTATPRYGSSSVHYVPNPSDLKSTFANLSSSTACSSQGSLPSVGASPSGLMSNLDHGFSGHSFDFGNATFQSSSHKTASAGISATALLQKAALMGATSSNNYLLRVIGNSGFSDLKDKNFGIGSSSAICKPHSAQLIQQSGCTDLHCGVGPVSWTNASAGMGPSNASCQSSYMPFTHNPDGSYAEWQGMPSGLMHSIPHVLDAAQLESTPRREFGEDRPMLDFLGVGTPSISSGTAPAIDSHFHKD